MRTTLNVTDRLLDLAKERAHELHLTLGEYVDRAIQTELEWGERAMTAPRPPLVTFDGGGGIRDGIDPTSNVSLLGYEEDDRAGTYRA